MEALTPRREPGKLRYALWFALGLLLLLVTNGFEVWTRWLGRLVTPGPFREVVWALNLVAVVGMFGCCVLLVSSAWRTRLLVELAVFSASLLAGVRLYRVFPFDLSALGPSANGLGRGALFVLLAGLGVGALFALARLASGWPPPRR